MTELNLNSIIETSGVPLLMAAVTLFYGIKVYFFKDTNAIRGGMNKELKDKDSYAKYAGLLLLGTSGCMILMAVLLFVNVLAAIIEMAITIVIILAGFKRIEINYGAK